MAPTTVPTSSPTKRTDQTGAVTTTNPFTFTVDVTVSPTCGTPQGLGDLSVELCFLTDATGSFADDLPNFINAANVIFNTIAGLTSNARFAVASYQDFPRFQSPNHLPYRFHSSMSASVVDFQNGIAAITIEDGGDVLEAGYEGIVGAAQGLTNNLVDEPSCGWQDGFGNQRILVVAADSNFHTPANGPEYVNGEASALEVLQQERIRLIGLETFTLFVPSELDALAAGTGGNTKLLLDDGSNIAGTIEAGLRALPCQVDATAVDCEPLDVALSPTSQIVAPGGTQSVSVTFSTTDPTLVGSTVECSIVFQANGLVVETVSVRVRVE